jgi:hypothetical protein
VSTDVPTYTIRVKGHLDDRWSARLGGAGLHRCADGTTSVVVIDADQARLHGVLAGLRDLGVELIELRPTTEGAPAPTAERP